MSEQTATSVDEQDQDRADDLAPGTELLHGQYKITAFLNAGGFGITYRAQDSLERPVVIKECFPGAFCRRSRAIVQARSRAHQSEFGSVVRHFVQEARSLSKLQHPNIVGVHQVFEENGTAYMALDFVEGRDLLDMLEDGDAETLTSDQVEAILRAVLDAIGFVHSQDMLHRDISPDNILLRPDMTPVLIDFGAARQQIKAENKVLSALRVVKDGYSPQEFYVTGSAQGPYSDLYALGASFYHVIAGVAPPDSQTRLSAIATGTGDPYKPLVGRIEGYPQGVLASIDRALAVLPKERVQSAADWLAIMDGKAPVAEAEAPADLTPPTKPANQADAPSKHRAGLMIGVAIAALAAAGLGAFSAGLFDAPSQVGSSELGMPVEMSSASVRSSKRATATAEGPAPAQPAAAQALPFEAQPRPDRQAATAETQLRPDPLVGASKPANGMVAVPVDPNTSDTLAPEIAMLDTVLPPDPSEDTTAFIGPVDRSAQPMPRPSTIRSSRTASAVDAPVQASLPNAFQRAPALRQDAAPLDALVAMLRPQSTPRPAVEAISPSFDARVIDLASRQLPTQVPVLQSPRLSGLSVSQALTGAPRAEMPLTPVPGDVSRIATLDGFRPLSLPAGTGADLLPVSSTLMDEAAVPGWDARIAIQAPEFGAEIAPEPAAPARVTTDWVVTLPYEDLRADAAGNLWIRSVEGALVEDKQQFNAAVHAMLDLSQVDEVSLSLGLGPQGSPAIFEQVATLPVAQETLLDNGLRFESIRDGDDWVTRLSRKPDRIETDLEVGDHLFAYIPTGQILNQRDSLATLLSEELDGVLTQLTFAVDRYGNRWLASLTYDPQTNP